MKTWPLVHIRDIARISLIQDVFSDTRTFIVKDDVVIAGWRKIVALIMSLWTGLNLIRKRFVPQVPKRF